MNARERIREAVAAGGVRRSIASGREAAVLVPIIERADGLWLVFTRRTDSVPTHKGQVSFPGGSRDAEDADSEATALRETHEELGIPATDVEVVGALNELVTVTGFRIAPHVGFVPDAFPYAPNAAECAEVLEIPIAELIEQGFVTRVLERAGLRRAVLYYRARGGLVWGVTASILHDFLERIRPVVTGSRTPPG